MHVHFVSCIGRLHVFIEFEIGWFFEIGLKNNLKNFRAPPDFASAAHGHGHSTLTKFS